MTKQVTKRRVCARPGCGKRLVQPTTGRPRRYCSAACRQHAYEARQRAQPNLSALLRSDIQQVITRRSEVEREVLRALLVLGVQPPGLTEDELRIRLERADEVAALEAALKPELRGR